MKRARRMRLHPRHGPVQPNSPMRGGNDQALEAESDRGVAVLAVALFEEQLRKAIEFRDVAFKSDQPSWSHGGPPRVTDEVLGEIHVQSKDQFVTGPVWISRGHHAMTRQRPPYLCSLLSDIG